MEKNKKTYHYYEVKKDETISQKIGKIEKNNLSRDKFVQIHGIDYVIVDEKLVPVSEFFELKKGVK